jgi:phage tail protein X
MPTLYTCRDGDMVDEICHIHYGTTSGGVVEAALEANYLLELDLPLLKAGQVITLPDIAAQPARTVVRLWD